MKHRVVRAILDEMRRQSEEDSHNTPYVDDERTNDVCLDGWFNIERVAEAVIKVMGEE